MPGKLTATTTLDSLKKQAKRWLRALRENDAAARRRLQHAHPNAPAEPVLRDIQYALAREYGQDSWKELRQMLEARAAQRSEASATHTSLVGRFLEYACPDHHVRGRPAHRMAQHAAMRILQQNPEIAHDNIYTAVVCGEIADVERILREQPELARARCPVTGPDRSGPGEQYDFLGDLGGKEWDPLLYLCFTRLPLAKANDQAIAIARLLLDCGADPNAYFMAGDSRYTPMVGVIGEGEEDRPPHPYRNELTRLLLERGAAPYDGQVIYNIHFHGKTLWWMKLIYEFSVKAGRRADWDDPEWYILDQGGYGSGARWNLRIAVEKNDIELAEWCLAHGANPNAAPERDQRFPQRSLYEHAVRLGHAEIAGLLAHYGAEVRDVPLGDEDRFVAACLRLDRDQVRQMLGKHPEFLRSTKAIFAAAKQDRADVVAFLLDLGTSLEVEDGKKQRPLHVAAANNALRVTERLIQGGAEVDSYELNYNNTPLDFAVYHDYPRMIELLTPHSHDVWSLTFTGALDRLREVLSAEPQLAKVSGQTTPLFQLPEDEHTAIEIVKLFLEHGADPGFRSKENGATAADVARKRGMHQVAALLEPPAPGNTTPSPARTAEEFERLARDFVNAYEGDTEALQRFNRHYGRSFTFDDLWAEIWRRVYAFRQRSSRVPKNYLQLEEAQTVIAQDAGFGNWTALVRAASGGAPAPVEAFEIDARENGIGPRRRLTDAEWDELIDIIKERRITSVHANGLMTDSVLARIAGLDHVTRLNLGGSRELTDDGLLHLARMPQLEHLELSEYPGGKLTDRGLEVLRHLPNLRTFEMTWQAGITDAGVANLRFCDRLERVNLMGSPTGDGAIEALQGKAALRYFSSGRLVTDAALPLLHNFPQFKHWHGPAIDSGSRDAIAGATHLLIDGPFTNNGLAGLAGLEGVFDFDLFWHVTGITSDAFAYLVNLPNLGVLGCDGKLSDDTAMRHIAAMPRLRRLRAQESVATDDGFVALSRSRTLEHFWGRVCPNFASRGFVALSTMPALRGFGISCKNVDDQALSTLPHFPALRELTPIDVKDDGFRHVGVCPLLDRLTCMYCRDTTDIATEHISRLPLKYYYAGLTQITDRSLEVLGRMPALEQVELYECKGVTDAGLVFLAGLPHLREVHLDGLPGVTLEGTQVFRSDVRVKYST
jgi:ankyrin repeat protein